MNYVQVRSKDLRSHGKIVDKTLFLPEGVHTRDRKPDPSNELFIKEKAKNPPERRIIF